MSTPPERRQLEVATDPHLHHDGEPVQTWQWLEPDEVEAMTEETPGDTMREMLDRLRQRKRKGDEQRRERVKLGLMAKHPNGKSPNATRPQSRRGR